MFQAFEYDASGNATQIDATFASELAKFLKAHSLGKRISIIANPADREDFIEFTHPSGRGTISVPLRLISDQEIEASEPVITGWSFAVNEHGVVEKVTTTGNAYPAGKSSLRTESHMPTIPLCGVVS
ncbi:hypothetical protein NUU61_001280 [Penicillium alfredii]|uniref:Uncharacterized protein n=1 Tax=Penicillium alfredii TaxID=1506179 RepID=A0A9W9GBA7_9EURO|nr:uncharacterized protein NUU61_001280 [Penicillium alfredii]KAJ5115521.1 hypothetical protein NUU61_001280 [Penicillium alfredii]